MVHIPSIKVGILNAYPQTCHQLEAPELPEPSDPDIPQVYAETTFQVPFGSCSALSELLLGNLSAIESCILTLLNYRSNYVSGETWRSSVRQLAKLLGISVRYLRATLSELLSNGWIERLSIGRNTGSRYRVTHHNCDRDDVPTDKNGNPSKFAVPRGVGGVFERLFAGDISWKSAVIWLVLKLQSDWQTGRTKAMSIAQLSKWVGMSPQTVSDCLKQLKKAGLLKRLSKKHEAGVYQLYPKPGGKPKPVYRPRLSKKVQTATDQMMRAEGDWRYSFNELWRINVESGQIQRRKSKRFGLWRNISDHQRYTQMPKSMRADFELAFNVHNQLKADLGVTDSAHSVTDSAQCVTHTAQSILEGSDGGSRGKG